MTRLALCVIIITFAIATRMLSQSVFPTSAAWGPDTDGLRVGISAPSSTLPSVGAQFIVMLQNTSDRDFTVNLGIMLGNGKVMMPSAVTLVLTDPSGITRELQFSDRRYPGLSGRIDDFTVSLRAGATYMFPMSLDQYWSPTTKEFRMTLTPGRHRIWARFQGTGAAHLNSDMPGLGLMNFGKGVAESGTLEFDVLSRCTTAA